MACFAPFLYPPSQLQQTILRIFPLHRGLFEDKVANVWCSLNVAVKLRDIFSTPALAKIAAASTLLATIPLVIGSVWTNVQLQPTSEANGAPASSRNAERAKDCSPTVKLLPHLLFASAMAFFLFSFQVHEKSILLPLMPLTLLMVGKQPGLPGCDYEWSILLNNVGAFR